MMARLSQRGPKLILHLTPRIFVLKIIFTGVKTIVRIFCSNLSILNEKYAECTFGSKVRIRGGRLLIWGDIFLNARTSLIFFKMGL